MQLIGCTGTLYSVLYSVSDTWVGLVTTYRLTYRPTVLHPAVLQTRVNQPVLSSSSLSEYFVLTLNKSVIMFDWLDWRCWIRAAVWVIFYQVTAWRTGQPLIILQLLSRRKSCGVTRPDWDSEAVRFIIQMVAVRLETIRRYYWELILLGRMAPSPLLKIVTSSRLQLGTSPVSKLPTLSSRLFTLTFLIFILRLESKKQTFQH